MSRSVELFEASSAANSIEPQRELVLRRLLGVDYEEAVESLIGRFWYDPETGEDAIVHILSGNIRVVNGVPFPGGFHHVPSAELMWPFVKDEESGEVVCTTRVVDTNGRENLYPAEPFFAQVVIGGTKKMLTKRPKKSGGVTRVVPAENTIFPMAYDAYAVLKAIVIALDNRDCSRDELRVVRHHSGEEQARAVYWGRVPMIDGESEMTIKIVTDLLSDKIITAMPIPSETKSLLLREDDMWRMILSGQGNISITEGGSDGA